MFQKSDDLPGKEFESLTTKVPGDLCLRRVMASSLEMAGLYQNCDESRTKTGCDFNTSPPSAKNQGRVGVRGEGRGKERMTFVGF